MTRIELFVRRWWAAAVVALMLAVTPCVALAQGVDPSAAAQAKIAQPLVNELSAAQDPVSILVILDEQIDPQAVVSTASADAALARRKTLYAALTAHAQRTQAPLRAWLDARSIPYTAHYLVNMLEVRGDLALAQQLAQRPEVGRLARNPTVRGLDMIDASRPVWLARVSLPLHSSTAPLPWGLSYTNADDAWALGLRGQGIVVASQDTGVVWDHPALKPAYRGWNAAAMTVTHPYNWFDAWGRDPIADSECPQDAQLPCDDNIGSYHGTHTLGTVAGDATPMGDTVIGMAPDATWIACRNMRDGFGTPSSYTACFEFFFAPYPQGGDKMTDGRPDLAPHVINNSWGCPPVEGCDVNSLRDVVEAMRAAGIYVAASAGNSGPSCSTVNNPIGMHDAVTSVGAHNDSGVIAGFSSRGPVTIDGSGRLKPDLSAPGVGVRSAGLISGQPTVYNSLSGTSMAAPHVAGAVALLWSLDPTLIGKINETEQILLNSTTPVLDAGCTGIAQSPNPVYGHGKLDILRAVETVVGDRSIVAANSAPPRSGVVAGGGVVAERTMVTLTATANPGYLFVNWTENDAEVSADATYVFTATGSHQLIANFTLAVHTIDVSANPPEGGSVSGGGEMTHGATVTVTANANLSYTFVNWTESGVVVSNNAAYVFTVTGDRSLVANFEPWLETIWLPLIAQ
jgi:subtilisin family serine protease